MEPQVRELLDKQSIADVVLRYCRGVDRLDLDLVRSCYHDSAIEHHTGYDGGVDGFIAWLRKALSPFSGALHVVGNQLVEVHGDQARCESYGTAHHWGEPADDARVNFTTGFRYVHRFTRRDGVWRIAERWSVREWARIVPAEAVLPRTEPGPLARRDRSDPLYLAELG
jgi:hypothetical protein